MNIQTRETWTKNTVFLCYFLIFCVCVFACGCLRIRPNAKCPANWPDWEIRLIKIKAMARVNRNSSSSIIGKAPNAIANSAFTWMELFFFLLSVRLSSQHRVSRFSAPRKWCSRSIPHPRCARCVDPEPDLKTNYREHDDGRVAAFGIFKRQARGETRGDRRKEAANKTKK